MSDLPTEPRVACRGCVHANPLARAAADRHPSKVACLRTELNTVPRDFSGNTLWQGYADMRGSILLSVVVEGTDLCRDYQPAQRVAAAP